MIAKIRCKKSRGGGSTDNVPKWEWTERQCQEWCTNVFIKYLEGPSGLAEYMARENTTWEPSLLLRSKEDWIKLVGEGRGLSIYKLIGELKLEKGAVPISTRLSIAFGKFADLLLAEV